MSRGEETGESVGTCRLDPVLDLFHPHTHIRVQKATIANVQRHFRVYEYISTSRPYGRRHLLPVQYIQPM